MKGLLRRRATPPLPPDPVVEVLRSAAQAKMRQQYAEGWVDGANDALRLGLGESRRGAEPYTGPSLPVEFVAWAQRALTKLKEGR